MAPATTYDVLILGGGPAGMTAAIWSAQLGLNPALVEQRGEFGGQLARIFNPIENYPGVAAADGNELRNLFMRSLDRCRFERRSKTQVVKVDLAAKQMFLENGESLAGRAIIVATGVRRRRLGIEGEDAFAGRGVMASGAGEKERVRGKRVVIVGGGDAALENSLILSEFAREVTVIHRRNDFSAREEFVNEARKRTNVRFEFETVAQRIVGNKSVEGIELRKADGSFYLIETDHVLIRVGVVSNADLLKGQVQLDEQGYGVVDTACRTSIPGVFLAGDVANPTSPTIATAVGMGATAAKAAFEFLTSKSK